PVVGQRRGRGRIRDRRLVHRCGERHTSPPPCGTRAAAGLRLPQCAAAGPPTPPRARGSSTRPSLPPPGVPVEGKTTIGVGAEPVRNSTHVGELHTLHAAVFKKLRVEGLAGVNADVCEGYASAEGLRVL